MIRRFRSRMMAGHSRVLERGPWRALLLALSACWLLVAAGCATDLRIRLQDDVERPARTVFIFFVDGMDSQRTEELLVAGRLPNIRSRFVDRGVRVRHALSSLPSTTYPNCSSAITGRFPGHHDVVSNFWFDRRTLVSQDYMTYWTYLEANDHLQVPTLYDLLGDRLTASIGNHTYRGVGLAIPNSKLFFWAWAFGRYTAMDGGTESALTEVVEVANRRRRWPTVIMTYYPGVDEIGHRRGTNSAEYAAALEQIDRIIGSITGAFEQAGLGSRTSYVLMADHGMVPKIGEGEIDILRWLRPRRGMTMRREPMDGHEYRERLAILADHDSVGTVDSGRLAMIHLRGARGWEYRPEPGEVLEWLNQEPAISRLSAVEVATVRAGDNRVRVLSRSGMAVIERKRESNGVSLYRMAEYQGDPLEYLTDASLAGFVRSGWHTSREWLAATAGAHFPDFVPQIVEMFDSPRTGDVVLMAAEGWLLYRRGEHAGHGSCLARDMRIPLFFAGPGLPGGTTIPNGRLVDVMPTILGLLGEASRLKDAGPIDGIDLTDQLLHAAR